MSANQVSTKIKRSRFWLAGFILAVLLGSSAASTQALEQPEPSIPPVWPVQSAAHNAMGEVQIFLPIVMRPPEPQEWVDTQVREASRLWYIEAYLGSNTSDAGWTGNLSTCDPGETSEPFKAAVLQRINYYRSMAGIPALSGLDESYNAKAQAAALMMSVNGRLSHTPDASWLCYSADGDEAAGSSNLYLGVYGPAAIRGYVNDPGTTNTAVGHRRWILYPQTRYMGSGDIPYVANYSPANALWVFDLDNLWGPRPETREAFVAWPPPGYVPYQVVYPRWSFAFAGADFSQASVTMTREDQPLTLLQHAPAYGYGENTLVWEPQTSLTNPPASDTSYQVTISQVLIDDQPQTFTYTVIIFNPE